VFNQFNGRLSLHPFYCKEAPVLNASDESSEQVGSKDG